MAHPSPHPDPKSVAQGPISDGRTLSISEIFDSVQGEGPSAGMPCTFLRLAGCNLRCSWCDTAYTWDWARFDRSVEVRRVDVDQVVERLRHASRLVITGGEPLLQQRKLHGVLLRLNPELPIEIETNGTVEPSAELLARVDQWNVSPKLANSGETSERAFLVNTLACLRDSGRAWLKFVVASAVDTDEALGWVAKLRWPRERVMLMPLASTQAELAVRLPVVQELCTQRGLRLSPRLHVERWGDRRGV